MEYPIEQCLRSLLPFCDEIIVVDGGSKDGTIELIQSISKKEPRVKLFVEPVDFSHPRWAIYQDGYLKRSARSKCTGQYCWQTDSDEIVDPSSYDKIPLLPEVITNSGHELVMLPMVEFWGSYNRIRGDFMSWKNRFSLNNKNITHGIPQQFKNYDQNGHEYPRPFESDTCNYIYADKLVEVVPIAPIGITSEEFNKHTYEARKQWFMESLERMPHVLHVSWLSLERKISHYQKFWQNFHASMYNLQIEDNAQTNVMFDKPWASVTKEEIKARATQLIQIGPRSFHKKIDPTKIGPTFEYTRPVPNDLIEWQKNLSSNTPLDVQTESPSQTPTVKTSSPPLISVVIPSYNKGSYLAETVESVLNQDYKNTEIIIVNDGSTDSTAEVAKNLINQYPHRSISLVDKQNGGAPEARNAGIERARGDLYMALDGDDLLQPSFLRRALQEMHDRNANVVCSDLELFGKETGVWRPALYNDYVIRYDNVIPMGSLAEKRLWQEVGGFKRGFPFAEDWEFWVACSQIGMKVYKIEEPLFRYRVTGDGLSEIFRNSHSEMMSVIMTSHPHLYPVEEVILAHDLLIKNFPERFVKGWQKRDALFNSEWHLKFWLGCVCEGQNALQEALNLYTTAVQLTNFKNWQPLYRIGKILMHANEPKQAYEFLSAARNLRPDMKKHIEPLLAKVQQVNV